MRLSQDIAEYYKQRFTTLTPDKQFHFASRLASWNQDAFSVNALQSLSFMTQNGDFRAVTNDLQLLLTQPPTTQTNAALDRQPYFDKYPNLRQYSLALFRVRHLLHVYDIDTRNLLLELCPLDNFADLSDTLQKDTDALTFLSTHAVNYLYLLHIILYADNLPTSSIAHVAYPLYRQYDISKPMHVRLLIYLYTHCIIGETHFYHRLVTENRQLYTAMLGHLETTIGKQFDMINLDNKLEFLVCCRILNYETDLFDRIYRECEGSISPHGTYLVDTLNSSKNTTKASLDGSEHRNVLFIMSTQPYSPKN